MNEVLPVAQVRLDVWLWAARFFRTRSLARQAVDTGKIDVAGQRPKASRLIRVGDTVQVTRGEETFDLVVRGLSDTRGPAPVAQMLYEEADASRARREQQRLQRAAMRDGYRPPEHKPDKRARRLIQALGDIDSI